MTRHGLPWLPEEDDLLRQLAAEPGPMKSKVDRFCGRTEAAIMKRCNDLGLEPRGTLRASHYSWVEQAIDETLKSAGHLSAVELAKATGASIHQVRTVLRTGHKTKYYVHSYTRTSGDGPPTRIWALGTRRDAKRPDPKPNAACCRDYDARQRAKRGAHNPFAGLIQQI